MTESFEDRIASEDAARYWREDAPWLARRDIMTNQTQVQPTCHRCYQPLDASQHAKDLLAALEAISGMCCIEHAQTEARAAIRRARGED